MRNSVGIQCQHHSPESISGGHKAPKTSKMDFQILENKAKMGPRGHREGQKGHQETEHGAKMKPKVGAPAREIASGTQKWPTWAQDGLQNGAQIERKSMPKSILQTMPFKTIFGMIWVSFYIKNQSKIIQKSIPRGIQKMIKILMDFWTILAPFWEPSWIHVGHFSRPRRVQNGPRWLSTRP